MVALLQGPALIGLKALPVQPCPVCTVEIPHSHLPFPVQRKTGMYPAHTAVIHHLIDIFPDLSDNAGKFCETDLLSPAGPGPVQACGRSGIRSQKTRFSRSRKGVK